MNAFQKRQLARWAGEAGHRWYNTDDATIQTISEMTPDQIFKIGWESARAEQHRHEGRWVVCAAIKSNTTGRIVAGARHWDGVMRGMILVDGKRPPEWVDIEQGFIDQRGNFLTRQEAWVIAEANNQIVGDPPTPGMLYSEDLYVSNDDESQALPQSDRAKSLRSTRAEKVEFVRNHSHITEDHLMARAMRHAGLYTRAASDTVLAAAIPRLREEARLKQRYESETTEEPDK